MGALAFGQVLDYGSIVEYNPNITNDWQNQTWAEYNYGVTAAVDSLSTSNITRITEVMALPSPKTTSKLGAYFDDLYYRINIRPRVVALGNLISATQQVIDVWNAYLEPKLLNEITGIPATAGVTVSRLEPEPSYFNANEEREYTFNISKVGDAILDFHAVFEFLSANQPDVYFTGRRLVIVPFKPLRDMKEKINWLTDILQAYDSEQRLALRVAGRQEFQYQYYLTEENFSKLKAIAFSWGFRIYAIPVWHEITYAGTVSEGASAVYFDTANADYRADTLIAVIGANDDIEAVEVSAVFPDHVVLKLPFPRTMTGVSIAPLRFARTLEGASFRREAPNHTFAAMDFLVTDNADLSESGDFVQYKGLDVVTDCIVLISSVSERLIQSLDVFDNGSGAIDVDTNIGYIGRTSTMTLVSYTRAELWRNRVFLHRMKGRRGVFWRPTFNRDMTLLANIEPLQTFMSIKTIGYALYYGITDFMVELLDGTRLFNRATSGVLNGATDVLQLETSFGVLIETSNIKRICFIYKSRIDTDSVEIRHIDNGVCHTVFNIREVPA